ncbi:MAG: ABC transporter substrate-binding protein [Actinobacteria bacterium]|nr:ABC transporter substrate-binding protein [Actinomycetota bacterium]
MITNITTDNWWASLDGAGNASQNQAYLTNMNTFLYTLTLPGFVYVPAMGATPEPVPAVQEGDIWVVEQPIRDDITWSDGTPVTANDLVFYFDTVKEFNLGSNHAASFPPEVLSITAPDDYTVRIEFASEPGLAVWQNGVGFASFVPAHFWAEHVDAARAAAAEVTSGITNDQAAQAIVDESLANEDPDDDVALADVTQEDIDAYIANAGSQEALTVLYGVQGPMQPSTGAIIFDQWEQGAFAATVANAGYIDNGTENTYYSDGSFRIVNSGRGQDEVFGGEGSGDILAQYVEGPFVSEILWVEHGTKDAAYEKLAAGELDYVFDPTGLTSGLRTQLATNPDLEFAVNATEGFRYLAFNLRKAPMSDLPFREALATVINKELVAETVLAGAAIPAYTVVHPDLTVHYNPDVIRHGWADGAAMDEGTRFETAIQILRDAGYTWQSDPVVNRDADGLFVDVTPGVGLTMPNGTLVPELTLMAPGPGYDPFRATFAIWIEQWANQLGIPLTTASMAFNAISATAFDGTTPEALVAWDMYMLGWGGGDPSLPGTSLTFFFHSREDSANGGANSPGYNSARFDEASDAFEAATDLDTAAELTKEMDAIIAEELPYIVLFRTPIIEAFNAGVQFPVDTIMGGMQGFPNAWPNAVKVAE